MDGWSDIIVYMIIIASAFMFLVHWIVAGSPSAGVPLGPTQPQDS